jgi:hypothetical protein
MLYPLHCVFTGDGTLSKDEFSKATIQKESCVNVTVALAYGVYISQFKRHFMACST